MADETRSIDVLIGPYRGHRLTVSAADADAAVNAHWAADPFAAFDPDNPHPPLSEEERTSALEAANTWAKAQWDAAQGVEGEGGTPPAQRRQQPEPRQEQRQMAPDVESGRYQTREQRPRDRSSER